MLAVALFTRAVIDTVPPAATLVGETVVICVKLGLGVGAAVGEGDGVGATVGDDDGAAVGLGAGAGVVGAAVGVGTGAGAVTAKLAAASFQEYCVPQPDENTPRLTRYAPAVAVAGTGHVTG